ncbi:hypothetical protein OIU78_007638 [Salix suchowensis]|nr:hypothetical protein OIU78_007638 [Salix suchowensis]
MSNSANFSLPPRYNEELVTLTVFEGCLGVSFFSTCLQPQYEIWVMKEYGKKESWTKLITVENPGFGELCEPLIFLNSGLILMMHCREYVVCYDTRTRFMEAIRIWQAQGNSYAMPYKPSFVSLKDVAKGRAAEDVKVMCYPPVVFLPHFISASYSTMLSPVTAIQQEKDGLAETSWKVLLS